MKIRIGNAFGKKLAAILFVGLVSGWLSCFLPVSGVASADEVITGTGVVRHTIDNPTVYGVAGDFFSSTSVAQAVISATTTATGYFTDSGSTTVGNGSIYVGDIMNSDGTQNKIVSLDLESFDGTGTIQCSLYGSIGTASNYIWLSSINASGTGTYKFLDTTYVERISLGVGHIGGGAGTIVLSAGVNCAARR